MELYIDIKGKPKIKTYFTFGRSEKESMTRIFNICYF